MKFKLEIQLDNASFWDLANAEVARILRELRNVLVSSPLLNDGMEGPLFDSNGNKVGEWSVYDEDPI